MSTRTSIRKLTGDQDIDITIAVEVAEIHAPHDWKTRRDPRRRDILEEAWHCWTPVVEHSDALGPSNDEIGPVVAVHNRTIAARILGGSRRTLCNKLKEHGLGLASAPK